MRAIELAGLIDSGKLDRDALCAKFPEILRSGGRILAPDINRSNSQKAVIIDADSVILPLDRVPGAGPFAGDIKRRAGWGYKSLAEVVILNDQIPEQVLSNLYLAGAMDNLMAEKQSGAIWHDKWAAALNSLPQSPAEARGVEVELMGAPLRRRKPGKFRPHMSIQKFMASSAAGATIWAEIYDMKLLSGKIQDGACVTLFDGESMLNALVKAGIHKCQNLPIFSTKFWALKKVEKKLAGADFSVETTDIMED